MLDELIARRSKLFKRANIGEHIAGMSTVITCMGLGAVVASFPGSNQCSRNTFNNSLTVALSSTSVVLVSTKLSSKYDKQIDALYWQIEKARNTKSSCAGCIYSSGDALLPCAIHPAEQREDCPDKSFTN